MAKKNISFKGDYDDIIVPFEHEFLESGRMRFSIEVSALSSDNADSDEEITFDNNRRSFYVNVLENKIRVLLVSGFPDNSLGDLVRRLKVDEHVELIQLTMRMGQSPTGKVFYEGGMPDAGQLKQIDVVILHNLPPRGGSSVSWKQLVDLIDQANLSVLFMSGHQVDYRNLAAFGEILPMSVSHLSRGVASGQMFPIIRHAITADPEQSDLLEGWSTMPPLSYELGVYTPLPQAQILAEIILNNHPRSGQKPDKAPAIVISETDNVKYAAILARGLWRMGMQSPPGEGVWDRMLRRLIRYLAVRKVDKQVTLKVDRDVVSNQEPVNFTVTVFNESFVPLDGAEVSAVISTADTVHNRIVLDGVGKGTYRGLFRPQGSGDFSVNVFASQDDVRIGTDNAKITVEPFNIELLDSRLNESLLRSISQSSGGIYTHIDEADSLLNSIDLPHRVITISEHWQIWGTFYLLTIVIMVLAVEWFIRIRTGMM